MKEVLLKQSGGQSQYGYGGNLITETTVKQAGALTQLEPSLENLSEKQVLAILERGRLEFREGILRSGSLPGLAKKYPGVRSSGQYWGLLRFGLSHEDPVVRRRAADSLRRESGPEALKVKAQALNHQDPDVRWRAAWSLSNESGP